MSGLQFLTKPISSIKGVGEKLSQKFQQLSLKTVLDLYFFVPRNYLKRLEVSSLQDLEFPSLVILKVKVLKHIPSFRRSPYKIIVGFDGQKIEILFFSVRVFESPTPKSRKGANIFLALFDLILSSKR